MAEVGTADRGTTPPSWEPTRLNRPYHGVLPLAEVVLRGNSLDQASGEVPLNGFLVNMEKVYEDFLGAALREALRPHGGRCATQGRYAFDVGGVMTLVPDLVWYVGRQPTAIVDAKYKARKGGHRRTGTGVPKEDIYQMYVYCSRLGATGGHLVYAKGEAAVASHEIEQAGLSIHVHTLDLDGTPSDLLAQIDALASHIAADAEVTLD